MYSYSGKTFSKINASSLWVDVYFSLPDSALKQSPFTEQILVFETTNIVLIQLRLFCSHWNVLYSTCPVCCYRFGLKLLDKNRPASDLRNKFQICRNIAEELEK